VAAELNELVGSSEIGLALFTFADLEAVAVSATEEITTSIDDFKTTAMSFASVSQFKFDIIHIPNIGLLPSKCDIYVPYCGQPCPARITSLTQEVSIKVEAMWKTEAVKEGKLEKIWCEDLVVPDPGASTTSLVAADLLGPSVIARRECLRYFVRAHTSTHIVSCFIRLLSLFITIYSNLHQDQDIRFTTCFVLTEGLDSLFKPTHYFGGGAFLAAETFTTIWS
jgi:hypothetical protein